MEFACFPEEIYETMVRGRRWLCLLFLLYLQWTTRRQECSYGLIGVNRSTSVFLKLKFQFFRIWLEIGRGVSNLRTTKIHISSWSICAKTAEMVNSSTILCFIDKNSPPIPVGSIAQSVFRRCDIKSRSSQDFSVDFNSVRLSPKISVYYFIRDKPPTYVV